MRLPFAKLHGAGNDFVVVAGANLPDGGLDPAAIAALCRRRTGIGADGLIVVAPPPAGADVDFVMTYYNRDGGEAEMCGNGARCAVAYARDLGLAGTSCRFATRCGPLAGTIGPEGIEVGLPPWRDLELGVELPGSPFGEHHLCHTGVPHLVIPVADVGAVVPQTAGPPLRRHPRLGAAGANVDWVSPVPGAPAWRLRTFERGVEAETLACGTGAAAAAVVLVRSGRAASPVELITSAGDHLVVTLAQPGNELRLRGPVVTVFTGEASLPAGTAARAND